MEKELDIGNIEYKRFIKFSTPKRQESLTSQLKFRLKEGNGFCIYYIGLDDDGNIYQIDDLCFNESIENLKLMCNAVNARIISITKKNESIDKFYHEVKIGDIVPPNEYRILNICSTYIHDSDDKRSIEFIGLDTNSNILYNDEYSIYDIKKISKTLLYIINCQHDVTEIIQYVLTFKPHLINFESIEYNEKIYPQYKSDDDFININLKLYQLFKSMGINYTFEESRKLIEDINNYRELLINPQISKNIMNIFDVLFNGKLLNDTKIYACITNNKIVDKDNIYLHLIDKSHKLEIIDIQHIGQSSLNVDTDKLISISTKHKIKNDYHICCNIKCICISKATDKIYFENSHLDYNKEYTAFYKSEKLKVQFNDTYIKLNKNILLDEKYLIIDLLDQFILINIY